MRQKRIYEIATAALLLLGAVAPAAGQTAVDWDPLALQVSRADLEGLLQRLEDVIQSPAYSKNLRETAEVDADRIRERLTLGDFRVGDRILFEVEGEELPDSVAVEPGPQFTLPVFGSISLRGVLRSELEDHLTKEIGRFVQNPVVHAESLIRVSIQGQVTSPGFYVVPSDMLVGEALMVAGGPVSNARMDALRIDRAGTILWEGDLFQEMIVDGRTLDQLGLRAGDQIIVPERTASGWWTAGQYALLVASTVLLGVGIR